MAVITFLSLPSGHRLVSLCGSISVGHTYTVMISRALTVLNIYLFRRVLQKLDLTTDSIIWLTPLFSLALVIGR